MGNAARTIDNSQLIAAGKTGVSINTTPREYEVPTLLRPFAGVVV